MPQSPSMLHRLLRWSEKYTKTDMVYLASGGFWLVMGQVGAIIFSFSMAVAFGHLASQDTYGNYKYVLTVATLLGVLSLSGLPTALTQSAARNYDGAVRQAFRLNFKWSAGLILVSLLGALYYAYFAHNSFLALSWLFIALFIPLLNGFSLYDALLIGKKKFRQDTLFYILENSLLAISIIATLFITRRAIILVFVYFLVSTVVTAFFYRAALKQVKNDTEDPSLLKYSFHLSAINVIGAIADKIDTIAVFTFLGPADLAVYTFAIAMPEQIKSIIKMITPLAMPKFAERSMGEIKKTLWWRILLLALALGAGTLLYILIVPFLFRLFFPVYLNSVPYSQLYAFSIVFTACTAPIVAVLRGHQKSKELYIATNVGSFLLIILLPIFAIYWGIWGVVVGQIIGRATNAFFSAIEFIRLKE